MKPLYLRILFSGIFLFSAFVKAHDFDATVLFFSSLSAATVIQTKILLSLLVFLEIFVAGITFLEADRSNYVYRVIMGILGSFLVTSLLLWIFGVKNCGCLGTIIVMTPAVSIIKNILLIILFHFISKNTIRRYRKRVLST